MSKTNNLGMPKYVKFLTLRINNDLEALKCIVQGIVLQRRARNISVKKKINSKGNSALWLLMGLALVYAKRKKIE